MHRVAALVPVKGFREAKGRLRNELGDVAATELAQRLASRVLEALHPLPVTVVTDDDAVIAFAKERGASFFRQNAPGLNTAVTEGYEALRESAELIVIAHGDLANPTGLGSYPYEHGITIWTDRAEQGTNVMCLPSGLNFAFAYGVGSAPRHRELARGLGFEPKWITNSSWALDIDEPSDVGQ